MNTQRGTLYAPSASKWFHEQENWGSIRVHTYAIGSINRTWGWHRGWNCFTWTFSNCQCSVWKVQWVHIESTPFHCHSWNIYILYKKSFGNHKNKKMVTHGSKKLPLQTMLQSLLWKLKYILLKCTEWFTLDMSLLTAPFVTSSLCRLVS